jgi:hypothetical protein
MTSIPSRPRAGVGAHRASLASSLALVACSGILAAAGAALGACGSSSSPEQSDSGTKSNDSGSNVPTTDGGIPTDALPDIFGPPTNDGQADRPTNVRFIAAVVDEGGVTFCSRPKGGSVWSYAAKPVEASDDSAALAPGSYDIRVATDTTCTTPLAGAADLPLTIVDGVTTAVLAMGRNADGGGAVKMIELPDDAPPTHGSDAPPVRLVNAAPDHTSIDVDLDVDAGVAVSLWSAAPYGAIATNVSTDAHGWRTASFRGDVVVRDPGGMTDLVHYPAITTTSLYDGSGPTTLIFYGGAPLTVGFTSCHRRASTPVECLTP